MSRAVSRFIEQLQLFRRREHVFNPWSQIDPEHDASNANAEHRAHNLRRYLTERTRKAKLLFIAEAPGYQGCHFSGIPMTSERILLNHHAGQAVYATDVFKGKYVRCSKENGRFGRLGANEPTATIVWKYLKSTTCDPREIVLWNAFAFHPMRDGLLTNRRPTQSEILAGLPILEAMLDLFPNASILAMGRVAEGVLQEIGHEYYYARHPANGGATQFRLDVSRALKRSAC